MHGSKIKVLFYDNSIGFGGAIKSLALVLPSLQQSVVPIVMTCQHSSIINKWIVGCSVVRYWRPTNYVLRERLGLWLSQKKVPGTLKFLILKCYASLDWVQDFILSCHISCVAKLNRVDIIHMNTGHPPEAIRAAAWVRTPYVVHLRGIIADQKGIRTRAELSRAEGFIAVSDTVAKSAIEAGAPENKMVVLHDPVDLKLFERSAHLRQSIRQVLGIKDDEVAVGIFGRVIPWKGQLQFVQACLCAMDEDRKIKAVIVGDESDGSSDYFNGIKEVIARSSHGNRFVLAGYQEVVEGYYCAMDIVVHSSIEPEPFGMVVPEGMAAGKPVIAANEGGPSEIIKHGIDGFLVSPKNTDMFARNIISLSTNPEKRKQVGENAKAKAMRQFSIEECSRGILKLYGNLLGLEF